MEVLVVFQRLDNVFSFLFFSMACDVRMYVLKEKGYQKVSSDLSM